MELDIDPIKTAVATAITALAGVVRWYLMNRKHDTKNSPQPPTPTNGNGVVLEQWREIGSQHKGIVDAYRQQVHDAEARVVKLMADKEEQAAELMRQAEEIATLKASVKILEAQVASLLKQVSELEKAK